MFWFAPSLPHDSRSLPDQEHKQKQPRDNGEWIGHSALVRSKMNMPTGAAPWSGRPGVALTGVSRTRRVVDLLDIASFASVKGKSTDEIEAIRHELVCDVSQGVERSPWARHVGTFTTAGEFYLFGADRIMTEREKFRALGFGPVNCDGLSRAQLKDLGGEAMALPSIGSVLAAVILAVDFPSLWSRSR